VNGADGVACFRESPQAFRAVLLDLTMPELGGGEALAQMRDIDASVPVVLMSGYSDAEIERNFADAGLAGFLQKPFRADDLYSVLARALAPT
jgi:FixJ family two-component response regulator